MVERDSILDQNPILIIGPYGSGKTSILTKIYNFLMSLNTLDDLQIQNEELFQILNNIEPENYELIWFDASEGENIRDLFYDKLTPLIERFNINLRNISDFGRDLENDIISIVEIIKENNPNKRLLFLIDEFECALNSNNRQQSLSFIQLLSELIRERGINLIIALQSGFRLPQLFESRFYILRISYTSRKIVK